MRYTRPLIGLNIDTYHDAGGLPVAGMRPHYWRAVVQAGGTPILLPPIPPELLEEALQSLHGFIMIGGDDISGERYGGKTLPTSITMERDREASDFKLLSLLLESPKPSLAICLGFQELNVGKGGTLYQDILLDAPPTSVRHYSKTGGHPRHEVEIMEGSALAGILGKAGTLEVNSSHHQGVRELGRGLRVTARAPDGLVEGVEVEGHPFFLGVQWHPEQIADEPPQARLFAALVAEAQKFI